MTDKVKTVVNNSLGLEPICIKDYMQVDLAKSRKFRTRKLKKAQHILTLCIFGIHFFFLNLDKLGTWEKKKKVQ